MRRWGRTLRVFAALFPFVVAFLRDRRRWILIGRGVPRTAEHHQRRAERLTRRIAGLGPTFIKLAQIFSSRADIFPEPYLSEIGTLQDQVPADPADAILGVIRAELGREADEVFDDFQREPLAAASLGQVHRATLRGGREVAVKVQRPNIRPQIVTDLEVLDELAQILDKHTETGRTLGFTDVVAEFRGSLMRELDYRTEASNLRTLAKDLAEFERLVVPQPVEDYTTRRVLTMDYVPGTNIGALSPVVLTDIDGEGLVETLFRAYLNQVLVNGFFHADPHAGNLLLTHDHRLAVIDLGMIGTVPERMRPKLIRLLISVSEGDGQGVADIGIELARQTPERFDRNLYTREVTDLVLETHRSELDDLNVGAVVLEITRIAASHGLRVPPELSLLGKALLNLDEVARVLAPNFEPAEAIQRYSAELLNRHMRDDLSLSALLEPLMQSKELMMELPGRLNKLSQTLADNKLELNLKNDRIDSLIVGMQKIANRITTGLVLAALIVGAALMMRIETAWTLFGYPALAVICFLLAAGGGFVLIWNIVKDDRELDEM